MTRITGTVHEYQYTILSYLAQFFLDWEMFQAKVVEKIKTEILFSIKFFFCFRKSCRLWDGVEQCVEPRLTIRHNRLAGWIPEATNTHSEYVILIVVPLQQWLHELASMLRYTYVACLVSCSQVWCFCIVSEFICTSLNAPRDAMFTQSKNDFFTRCKRARNRCRRESFFFFR